MPARVMPWPPWEFTVLDGLVFGRLRLITVLEDGVTQHVLEVGLVGAGHVTAMFEVTVDQGEVQMRASREPGAPYVRIPQKVEHALLRALRERVAATGGRSTDG